MARSFRPSDFKVIDVVNQLASISSKWNEIGIALEVEDNELASLRQNSMSDVLKLEKVIRSWHTANPGNARWDVIISAVEGPLVGNNRKADEIRQFVETQSDIPSTSHQTIPYELIRYNKIINIGFTRVCFCYEPAKLRVSRRKYSRGREFYNCGKPYYEQCGYFEWADEPRQSLEILLTILCDNCKRSGHTKINCIVD